MGAYVGGKKILDLSRATIRGNVDFNGGNLTDVGTLQGTTIIAGAKSVVGYQNYVEADPATLVVSKDVERKFWKDDFSVDSSSQYTGDVANFTWDTANGKLLTNGSDKKYLYGKSKLDSKGVASTVVNWTHHTNAHNEILLLFGMDDSNTGYAVDVDVVAAGNNGSLLYPMVNGVRGASSIHSFGGGIPISDGVDIRFEVRYSNGSIKFYVNGVQHGTEYTAISSITGDRIGIGFKTFIGAFTELTYTPSISYADDFSTDTTERYQAVTGTVAYDDTNKRMNVTTATGANGKASGRLKSYKFCEGAQQFDVTLPVGADGDFICMVTHATNAAMTNGIGVGLQSDGAGNWNLATLSNTTVTEGASSGLVDGKTARIEIEKDITGAYWYYIYDASGTKPTTATGKLFTTKSEGYTGWYAKGNSKTYAIDNISIRAESIVGRTNVEVTEPFWFRDEFSDPNSIRRYTIIGPGMAISDGVIRTPDYANRVINPNELTGSSEIFADIGNASGGEWAGVNLFATDYLTVSAGRVTSGYRLEAYGGTRIRLLKNGTQIESKDGFDFTSVTRIGIRYDADTHTVYGYVGGAVEFTYVDPDPCVRGYALLNTGNISGSVYYDNLQISGTRVYQKPIHRGAMAETVMLDGIETVATTIAYDFNWDCIGEFSGVSSSSVDVVNGRLTLADTDYIYPTGHSAGLGYYQYRIMRSAASGSIELYVAGNVISITNAGAVSFNGGAAESYTIAVTAATLVAFDVGATSIAVYADGVLKGTKTGLTITSSNPKMKRTTADFYVSQMIVVALSPDAIDGFAPSLAGVGGGARFDAVEYIQSTLVNAAKYGKYLLSACCKTTDSDAEAAELYFKNSTDDTDITSDASDTETIALADTNYADFTKDLVLNYDDIGDTVDLRVRRTTATTHNQPPVYVRHLALTPRVEVG